MERNFVMMLEVCFMHDIWHSASRLWVLYRFERGSKLHFFYVEWSRLSWVVAGSYKLLLCDFHDETGSRALVGSGLGHVKCIFVFDSDKHLQEGFRLILQFDCIEKLRRVVSWTKTLWICSSRGNEILKCNAAVGCFPFYKRHCGPSLLFEKAWKHYDTLVPWWRKHN